jgi:hypothetical protein
MTSKDADAWLQKYKPLHMRLCTRSSAHCHACRSVFTTITIKQVSREHTTCGGYNSNNFIHTATHRCPLYDVVIPWQCIALSQLLLLYWHPIHTCSVMYCWTISHRYRLCHNVKRRDGKKCLFHSSLREGIKGFVGLRHFSSLGPFEDSKSIVGTTVYSRLSGVARII